MIERAQQFLNKLASMSEEEVETYFVGAGSTREAYVFEDNYVIKLPRFVVRFDGSDDYSDEMKLNIIKKGVQQTETEIAIYRRCLRRIKYLLNPVTCHGRFMNMPFVVMPRLKIASEVVHFSVEDIFQFIEVLDLCVPWSFSNDLLLLGSKHNLYYDDLWSNMDNFGINSSNRLFISDYGFKDKARKIIA